MTKIFLSSEISKGFNLKGMGLCVFIYQYFHEGKGILVVSYEGLAEYGNGISQH